MQQKGPLESVTMHNILPIKRYLIPLIIKSLPLSIRVLFPSVTHLPIFLSPWRSFCCMKLAHVMTNPRKNNEPGSSIYPRNWDNSGANRHEKFPPLNLVMGIFFFFAHKVYLLSFTTNIYIIHAPFIGQNIPLNFRIMVIFQDGGDYVPSPLPKSCLMMT